MGSVVCPGHLTVVGLRRVMVEVVCWQVMGALGTIHFTTGHLRHTIHAMT